MDYWDKQLSTLLVRAGAVGSEQRARFPAALILTIANNVGLDKLPVLLMAEMCPLGKFISDEILMKHAHSGSRAVTAAFCFISNTLINLAQVFIYPPTHPFLSYWLLGGVQVWEWKLEIIDISSFCFVQQLYIVRRS